MSTFISVTLNSNGLDLIKEFEGFNLTVYKDPVGLPTVGWGHLVRPKDGLKLGDVISRARAQILLLDDLEDAMNAVKSLVTTEITENAFSALVSFAFNLGAGNLAKSTLLKLVNQRKFSSAASEFAKWNKARDRNGVLKVLTGLSRRRAAEAKLFLTP